MKINPFTQKSGIAILNNGLTKKDVGSRGYLSFAVDCLDNLMQYGTDRYGREHHNFLVSILDVKTKNCPEFPPRTTCSPGGRPGYIPTPFWNTTYDVTDLSWGFYHAYVWESFDQQSEEIGANGLIDYSFAKVNTRALAVKVKLSGRAPSALYEIIINGGSLRPSKTAATYHVSGAPSGNSIYSKGSRAEDEKAFGPVFEHNISALSDGLYPQKEGAGSEESVFFTFLEREMDYSKDLVYPKYVNSDINRIDYQKWNPKKAGDEWILLELEREEEIKSISLAFKTDSGYVLPGALELNWATELDYSKVEYPDITTVPWRGEKRECYWKPRGSDFYEDQALINAMISVSRIKEDRRYLDFSQACFADVLSLSKEVDLFWWGAHRTYDVFLDKKLAPNGDYHEIHVKRPNWHFFWEWNKDATRKALQGIYNMHIVDKKTGAHNRHDSGDGGDPCCISMSGGQFIYALTFLSTKTGDSTYLDMARTVANFHYSHRDPNIGLPPDCPPADREGFPTTHCGYEVIGTMCYCLLKSYEISRVELFRDHALGYLKSFGKFAYDEKEEKFFAEVNIHTGDPITGTRWDAHEEPRGYSDLWAPYQYGFEHPIIGAQTYAYAYHVTKDADILYYAEKWAKVITENPPESGCRPDSYYEMYARLFSTEGTFAELYGRTVSFFLCLYRDTGDTVYMAKAKEFADEAVVKLYYDGLFRGHPARNYYCNVDGVGFLVYALVQLHVAEKCPGEDFYRYVDIDNY